MTENPMNQKIETYLNNYNQWTDELKLLRDILLTCDLTEEFKWGKPCYTFNGNNVVMIIAFKNYCALSFLKGALLDDPDKVLISPGEHSQSARQMRYTNTDDIKKDHDLIVRYVKKAVEIERKGLHVEFTEKKELNLPQELLTKFEELPELKTAFEALTPGRQRAYMLYFSSAKQSATKTARIEKYVSKILKGKGMND